MSGPRIAVTGGRDYSNYALVKSVLDTLSPSEVAEGGASGADRLVALWTHETGTPCRTYAADWSKHGRAAGPIRNRAMLDEFQPDLLVAFSGGRGTADCIRAAEERGIRVLLSGQVVAAGAVASEGQR